MGCKGYSIIIFMQLSTQNISLLRKGCNSQILLLQEQDMQMVIKAVGEESGKEVKHLQNEWAILSKVAHQNIVEVYRFRKNIPLAGKTGNYSLLAQEYARHGNLLDFIKKKTLSVPERRLIFWQVGQALKHLHGNSIVHRDIKLDNILIIDAPQGVTPKLADFGFATVLPPGQNHLASFKGTRRGYMAPEIHQCREDPNKKYDTKAADIFAMGVVLFAIVLGRLPFEFALASDKLYSLVIKGKWQQFWGAHASVLAKLQTMKSGMRQQFEHLFENLVTMQAQKRLTIQELLSHPWMAGLKQRPQI